MNILKPKLIILPGLDGTGKLLIKTKEVFSTTFNVELYQYPADKKLGYTQLIDYFQEKLNKETSFYLLGESFGGPLAIHLANLYQDKIKGLVLCATFNQSPLYFASILNHVTHLIPYKMPSRFVLDQLLFFPHQNEFYLNELINTLPLVNDHVLKYRIQEVLTLKEIKPQLNMPILYLQGKFDKLILNYNYQRIKKDFPQIKRVIIPSGHMVLQTHPKEALDAIKTTFGL